MAQASKDQNSVASLLGVSNVDGTTPVRIYADPDTHRLLVDIPGGAGTVTSVSVVSANGFAGTVATATSTPAITLSTTITGILQGNGTAISAATATGTGNVVLATSPTFSGATITTSSVNGVTLTTGGGTTTFLNANGAYSTPAGSGGLTVGTTTISGGTSGNIEYNNGGVLGEMTTTGTGTVVALSASPTFTGTIIGQSLQLGAAVTAATAVFGTSMRVPLITGGTAASSTLTLESTTGAGTSDSIIFKTGSQVTALTLDTSQNATFTKSVTTPVITASGTSTPASFTNSTDSTSVQVVSLVGARATPTANDEIYQSFNLNSSTGVTREFGRLTVTGTTVTNTSEVGRIKLSLISAGSLIGITQLTPGVMSPTTNDGTALGSTALMWSDLFLASGGVINWNNGTMTLTQASTVLTLGGGDFKISSPGNVSTSVLTTDATQNISNKRITKRVSALSANSATPAINTNTTDVVHITAQTAAITSFTTNLTGTPVDGDTLRISVTGTTSVALTFGASFEASTVALPTTTSGTTRLDMGFLWNTETTKWRIVAVA